MIGHCERQAVPSALVRFISSGMRTAPSSSEFGVQVKVDEGVGHGQVPSKVCSSPMQVSG